MRMKLQRMREAQGHTQASFAEAVGISRSHYSQIETGDKDPAFKLGLKIKETIGYTGDDIFLNEKAPFCVTRK